MTTGPSRGLVIGGAVAAAVGHHRPRASCCCSRDGDGDEGAGRVDAGSRTGDDRARRDVGARRPPMPRTTTSSSTTHVDHHHARRTTTTTAPTDHDRRADDGRAVRCRPCTSSSTTTTPRRRRTPRSSPSCWPGRRRRSRSSTGASPPRQGRGGGSTRTRGAGGPTCTSSPTAWAGAAAVRWPRGRRSTASSQAAPGTDQLRDAVATINDEVVREATNWGFEHVGTTLLAAVLGGPIVTVVHVGDSRAYRSVGRALRPAHRRPQRAR